jgi:hypothetical protein
MQKTLKQPMFAIQPWIILGALALLVPIFLFWTLHNLNKQKEGYDPAAHRKGSGPDTLLRGRDKNGDDGNDGKRGR